MDPSEELAFLRFLNELDGDLERVRDVERALRVGLRLAQGHFAAREAAIAVCTADRRNVRTVWSLPSAARWDEELLAAYWRGDRPRVPRCMLLARLARRGRPWGVLAMSRRDDYPRSAIRSLVLVAERLSAAVALKDGERMAEVRSRLDQKLLAQIRPQDFFYQLLHGLRTLTNYDHSAALLLHEGDPGALVLVAEHVAWRPGGSARVGSTFPVTAAAAASLEKGQVLGFDRDGAGQLVSWSDRDGSALAELLVRRSALPDQPDQPGRAAPPEGSLLCAPLATREGLLGVLVISSLHAGSFGPYEAELVRRFLPQAGVALRNLRRAESIELGLVQAERKHVMAGLARGVAHDVNNGFGAVLPLVQQMIEDLQQGQSQREVLLADLRQVESSLRTCRRIFGGMLSFARGAGGARVGEGDLGRAIESTLAILDQSLRRLGIRATTAIPDGLPAARGAQGDLEQLVLNLATNARDAMPAGGELDIAVANEGDALALTITDTGTGIPPEHRSRIEEPFFTTKRHGTGLGLSICRAIVRDLGGELTLESQPGEGTRAHVRLPLATSRRVRTLDEAR